MNEASKPKHSARNAAVKDQASSSTSDDEAMVVNHALAATHFRKLYRGFWSHISHV